MSLMGIGVGGGHFTLDGDTCPGRHFIPGYSVRGGDGGTLLGGTLLTTTPDRRAPKQMVWKFGHLYWRLLLQWRIQAGGGGGGGRGTAHLQ